LDMVKDMAATGVGVLYVTHHLGEVFRIGQKVSVFRDGVVVGDGPVEAFDHAALVQLLAGEDLQQEEAESRRRRANRDSAVPHAPVVEVDGLCAGGIHDVTLSLASGEIVGIAGLSGSGRDTLLGTVFGAIK